jgi:hypothetical protein
MMRRRLISWMAFIALCTLAALAFAADVSDFQKASTKEGCEAIPFQYTQDECNGYQTQVKMKCHGRKFGSRRDEVERLIAKIEEKQRNLAEAKSHNNHEVIPNLEAAITKLRDKVKPIKADAAGNLYKANECLAARERVQRVFKDATTSVNAAANADPELKPYASILVAKYKQGAAEHLQAIDDVKNAKVNLIWVKDVAVP